MTKGKIAELLALGAGASGGFVLGGRLANKSIATSKPGMQVSPMVTNYHIRKHPRLEKYIEGQIEKKADAKSALLNKIKNAPTSAKTIAGMATLGLGAGVPAGYFYKLKMHNSGLDLSGIEHASAITNMVTDSTMSTLDKLKKKQEK